MKNKYEIHGDVTSIFLNSPTFGIYQTLIDTEDLERVQEIDTWNVNVLRSNNKPYAYGTIKVDGKRKQILLHRYIMNETNPKIEIDHIKHNTLDNRKSQLRAVTSQENKQNSRLSSRNKSGVIGVSRDFGSSKWVATISINGKKKTLGRFTDLKEAEKVRLEAVKKYYKYKRSILDVVNN